MRINRSTAFRKSIFSEKLRERGSRPDAAGVWSSNTDVCPRAERKSFRHGRHDHLSWLPKSVFDHACEHGGLSLPCFPGSAVYELFMISRRPSSQTPPAKRVA